MFHRRSALAILVAAILSLLAIAFPGAAAAGGPTSVILVVPGEGRTASLYTGSPEYDELARLVGMSGGSSGDEVAPPGMGEASGITITWLIHDAQVWRVDRVDLVSAGEPSITTQEDRDGGSIWDASARTHSSGDGKALVTLLDRLGVGPDSPMKTVAAEHVPVVTRPAAASAATSGRPTGWVWGTAGALLGAVVTVLVVLSLPLGRRMVSTRTAAAHLGGGGAADDLELLDSRSSDRHGGGPW